MGNSDFVGHYSAAQKDQLGWLGPRIVDLTAGPQEATLSPFELDSGATVAAKLPVPSGRTYYFEYRQPVGVDAGIPAGDLDGVLVHTMEFSAAPGPDLLDLQHAPPSTAEEAALPFDTPWTTPEGWTVTATSAADGVHLTAARPAPPTFSVNDVSVTEGDKGTKTVTFTVTRAGDLAAPSSIGYKTVNGTAKAGSDYVAIPGRTLKFAAGQSTKPVTVVIKNDKKKEKTETFTLSLSQAVGATILDPTGVATILDND
jgi:Calx-beta domain